MEATAILAAAFRYKTNRDNQGEIPWNKNADCQNLFGAMLDQGLVKCNSCAGTFSGTNSNGELFVINIEEKEITIGAYGDFSEFLEEVEPL